MKTPILKTLVVVAISIAAVYSLAAQMPAKPLSSGDTIVKVASGNPDFSTLVTALAAADLVEALQGTGPFTVFAPNNAAFAKLPAGTLEDLLKPANKAKLVAILKNHVVEGKVMAANVKAGSVETLGGNDVVVAIDNGTVKFGNALVIGTDIEATNGVIHVIDTVVVPD
jgi:uncharacterized surface protein with fasciclin (FAS1) repeats